MDSLETFEALEPVGLAVLLKRLGNSLAEGGVLDELFGSFAREAFRHGPVLDGVRIGDCCVYN
jgi:hypothetical protein